MSKSVFIEYFLCAKHFKLHYHRWINRGLKRSSNLNKIKWPPGIKLGLKSRSPNSKASLASLQVFYLLCRCLPWVYATVKFPPSSHFRPSPVKESNPYCLLETHLGGYRTWPFRFRDFSLALYTSFSSYQSVSFPPCFHTSFYLLKLRPHLWKVKWPSHFT